MLIEALQSVGSFTVGLILPFLFILMLIVFVHEMGHFLVARWCGVTVKTFSIGFGRELFGFTDRKGTRWRLSLVPLGGYVKFLGDDNASSASSAVALEGLDPAERPYAFASQPVRSRAAIVAAGPIANFLLAIIILSFLYSVIGRPVTPPEIDQLVPGGAAEIAGFEPGDIIRSIDGRRIDSFTDISRSLAFNYGTPIDVVVERQGAEQLISVTPQLQRALDPLGRGYNRALLGVQSGPTAEETTIRRYSLPASIGMAADETWFTLRMTVTYIGRVFTGRESIEQLGGPITVARAAEQAADIGINALLALAAVLSISIGFVNLLPIPLLDGGHLLFYAAEAIRGRPLSDRAQEVGLRIGMVLILMLMVVAFSNDLGLFPSSS